MVEHKSKLNTEAALLSLCHLQLPVLPCPFTHDAAVASSCNSGACCSVLAQADVNTGEPFHHLHVVVNLQLQWKFFLQLGKRTLTPYTFCIGSIIEQKVCPVDKASVKILSSVHSTSQIPFLYTYCMYFRWNSSGKVCGVDTQQKTAMLLRRREVSHLLEGKVCS